MYQEAAKELLDAAYTADFEKMQSLVMDVDSEVKKLDRLYIKLDSTGFDKVYIASIQHKLHKCYKSKTKKLGIKIC